MDIFALTPYEALGTYTGLEIQYIIRNSLPYVPVLLIIAMSYAIVTALHTASIREKAAAILKYNIVTLFIIGALWPEAMGIRPTAINATSVKSGIVVKHGGPQQNAAVMGQGFVQPAVPAPPVMQVAIAALSQLTFNLGAILHEGATRPASFVMPMNWLLRQRLSHQDRIGTKEWAKECVAEAYLLLQKDGGTSRIRRACHFRARRRMTGS